MPRGPKGEKRPADGIASAVIVAQIATGEEEDTCYKHPNKVKVAVLEARRVRKINSRRTQRNCS